MGIPLVRYRVGVGEGVGHGRERVCEITIPDGGLGEGKGVLLLLGFSSPRSGISFPPIKLNENYMHIIMLCILFTQYLRYPP